MKHTIHVHQQKIKKGEPAIIVRTYKGVQHFTRVEIDGPVTIIHAQQPDHCGARVVIETEGPVIGHTDWEVGAVCGVK